jgi:hypothetical protein
METTQIKNYLLGSLSVETSATLEERLLTDDDFFELLQAEEDELIDQYLANELPLTERQQFEQIFLAAPARRERLSLVQALHQQFAQAATHEAATAVPDQAAVTPASIPWWRTWWNAPWTYATAAVLIAVIGWGLWRTNTPTLASFTLTPNAVRAGNQGNVVAVPAGALTIKLLLELEVVGSGPYQAVLRDEAGNVQQRWEGLQPQDKQQIALEVSSALLAAGTYRINLTAATNASPADEYVFQVTR